MQVRQDPSFGWSSTTVPPATATRYGEALTVLKRALNALPDQALVSATPTTVTTVACGCGHRARSTRSACAPVAVQCTACERVH